jgi:hypothetical protein
MIQEMTKTKFVLFKPHMIQEMTAQKPKHILTKHKVEPQLPAHA